MNNKKEREIDLGLSGLEYYRLDDFKQLLSYRKWLIVFVALAVAVATAAAAVLLPNSYKAKTEILVDPGKVPESYVRPTATMPASERLDLLREQILSDTKLSQIIDELNLYSNMKNTTTLDVIVDRMRKDIELQPVFYEARAGQRLTAFTISYRAKDPTTAARVANRLGSLFIDENLRTRQEQVLGTAEFMDREVEKARKDLAEKAQKLQELRTRHASELPEAQNAHIQAMTSLQLELRGEMDAVSRDQQQKVYLESMLADSAPVVDLDSSAKSQDTDAADGDSSAKPRGADASARDQMARLQTQLELLRTRYGPNYPDVVKTQELITQLKAQSKTNDEGHSNVAAPPVVATRHNPVIESQIQQLDDDIKKRTEHEQELRSEISYHQGMLDKGPLIAQQFAALTRDYELAETNYNALQPHKFAADVSSDMETRQKGERFVILEPAQAPPRPDSPNRPLIDALGLAAGLAVALALVLGLEILTATVNTEREIAELVPAPILGKIPRLGTQAATRRQKWMLAFSAGGNTLLTVLYLGLLVRALR